MLTVMCPNCRHSFASPGGCCPGGCPATSTTKVSFDHHLPTSASGGVVLINTSTTNNLHRQQVTISTKYDTVSGGCLIQQNNNVHLQPQQQHHHHRYHHHHHQQQPKDAKLEMISKMSGGGCVVQQNETAYPELNEEDEPLLDENQLNLRLEKAAEYHRGHSTTARLESPPSGCQELPGIRREPSSCRCSCRCSSYCKGGYSGFAQMPSQQHHHQGFLGHYNRSQPRMQPDFSRSLADLLLQPQPAPTSRSSPKNCSEEQPASGIVQNSVVTQGDVEIQVNATVRLPCTTASGVLNSCTFSFTASRSSPSPPSPSTSNVTSVSTPTMNSFNGGGIVGFDTYGIISDFIPVSESQLEEPPTTITPVSWISFSGAPYRPTDTGILTEKDVAKLMEVKNRLQMAGWYHEDLSWQQSQELLKDAPVGTWFMRNSSDERYAFAVSVQTTRGPTSIRVLCIDGMFRLDAEPKLADHMPLFDCPFQMMEHYREYSKMLKEDIQEVWVDFHGVKFTKIYLSEPLLKQVRSLQHLARIAINKNRERLEQRIERLAPSHKAFLAEYPHPL